MQKLAHGEGELDVAGVAFSMGLNMTLSSNSTTSLEDVMSVNHHEARVPFWFQIYMPSNQELIKPLLKRVEGKIISGPTGIY